MGDVTPGDNYPSYRLAAVQAAPVFLDRSATVDKTGSLVAEAARAGARLVVFGEAFVPGFPLWALVRAPLDNHELFRTLYRNAVLVPGDQTLQLGAFARQNNVFLSIGVTERSAHSMGSLYNTNLLFDPTGRIIGRHRKLVPTWAEKLIWTPGDGSTLQPAETELGRIGVLICGENTNTLARYALLAQGEQVHLSTYPPAWPFQRGTGTNYTRWLELRAASHSFEGKVFTVVASVALGDDCIQTVAAGDRTLETLLREAPRSASFVVQPTGELAGPMLVGDEGIIYADIDIGESIIPKQAHDIIGNYQRLDVFQLHVDKRPQELLHIVSATDSAVTEELTKDPPEQLSE
jgi:nitrilase/aliphatic nitrilase